MKTLICSILAGVGALALMCPQARADEWNKKTIFTFSQPVEVPGRVLPAGSYVFKLADSQSNRHIVQVFNKRENHIYGTYLAIPAYRAKTPDKPIITFEERAAGTPPAVKEWFYPGDNYGDEFVYPKVRSGEMASLSTSYVPPAPSATATTTEQEQSMNQAPVPSTDQSQANATESEEQEEMAQNNPPAPPASVDNNSANRSAESTPAETSDQNAATDNSANENANQQLPKTGSNLPLIGLIGLVSLGAGFSLRAVANRVG